MQTKICTICGIEKDISEFSKHPTGKYGVRSTCNFCRNEENKKYRKTHKDIFSKVDKTYKEKYPWRRTWNSINQRCNNITRNDYQDYGAKGIKNLFKNWDELKELWFRDKAYLLERPSIDRLDDLGHYCLENCRYIEYIENARKVSIKNRKPVLQYDFQENFLAEYESISKAAQDINVGFSKISKCANKKITSAYGYIWKFKD